MSDWTTKLPPASVLHRARVGCGWRAVIDGGVWMWTGMADGGWWCIYVRRDGKRWVGKASKLRMN